MFQVPLKLYDIKILITKGLHIATQLDDFNLSVNLIGHGSGSRSGSKHHNNETQLSLWFITLQKLNSICMKKVTF